MKAAEALTAWTPAYSAIRDATRGKVEVGPLLQEGDPDWTRPYAYTGGAAYVSLRTMDEGWRVAMVFIEFHTMVVRDGIDPQVAHRAFLTIDEYAERIALDIPGARR